MKTPMTLIFVLLTTALSCAAQGPRGREDRRHEPSPREQHCPSCRCDAREIPTPERSRSAPQRGPEGRPMPQGGRSARPELRPELPQRPPFGGRRQVAPGLGRPPFTSPRPGGPQRADPQWGAPAPREPQPEGAPDEARRAPAERPHIPPAEGRPDGKDLREEAQAAPRNRGRRLRTAPQFDRLDPKSV